MNSTLADGIDALYISGIMENVERVKSEQERDPIISSVMRLMAKDVSEHDATEDTSEGIRLTEPATKPTDR